MKQRRRVLAAMLCIMGMAAVALSGCSAEGGEHRRIVRVGHNQATDHPTNIALTVFEEYIESEFGGQV